MNTTAIDAATAGTLKARTQRRNQSAARIVTHTDTPINRNNMGLQLDQIQNAKLRRKIEEADAIQNCGRRVGSVQAEKPKSNQRGESQDTELESGQDSMAIRISFCLFTRRLLDSDNKVSAAKNLRDIVCESLGLENDADSEKLSFEYQNVITSGEQGVLVKIELE